MTWDPRGEETDDLFDCPFCGREALVRSDALLFGCTCGGTFQEEDAETIEFTPEDAP